MKPLSRTVLAGAAFLALGTGALAVAAAQNSHVLDVRLPDGTIEHIRYTGDVAPTVRLEEGRPIDVLFAPVPGPLFAADPVFARLEQVSAEMDREAAAMLASLDDMTAPAPAFAGLAPVDLAALPAGAPMAGAQGYTMVSTVSGDGVCTRTTEYTARPGQAPLVKTSASGACGDARQAAPHGSPEIAAPAAPTHAPGLIQASYRAR